MTQAREPGWRASLGQAVADAKRLDEAVYRAVAGTPTPSLDRGLSVLTEAANYSRIWVGSAAALAVFGGPRGRRAAVQGLASVAITSATVNAVAKRIGRRARPDRSPDHQPGRAAHMPTSPSFPSGHSASAFAFATGVGHRLPVVAIPLHAAAGLVAYSRVHSGVHFPGDVVIGSMLGTVLAQVTCRALDLLAASASRPSTAPS